MTRSVQALVNLHPFIRLTAVVAVAGYFLFDALRETWLGMIYINVPGVRQFVPVNSVPDIARVMSAILFGLMLVLVVLTVLSDTSKRLRGSLGVLALFLLGEGVLTGALLSTEIGVMYVWNEGNLFPIDWRLLLIRALSAFFALASGFCLIGGRRVAAAFFLLGTIVYNVLFVTMFATTYAEMSRLDYLILWLRDNGLERALQLGMWPQPPPWTMWVIVLLSLALVNLPHSWRMQLLPGQRWREAHVDVS